MEAYNLALVFIVGGLALTVLSIYFLVNLKKEEKNQKERNSSNKSS